MLRPKEARVLQPCQWPMLVFGTDSDPPFPSMEGVLNWLIRFAEKVIKASKGEKGIVEPTYVYLPGVSGGEAIAKETGVDYFSVPIELGVRVKKIPLPKMIAKNVPSRPEPKRPPTSFHSSMTTRRSFSRPARRVSRATLKRVSNLCTTRPQSDSPTRHSCNFFCLRHQAPSS